MNIRKYLPFLALSLFLFTSVVAQQHTAQQQINESIDDLNREISKVYSLKDSLPEDSLETKLYKGIEKFDYQLNKFSTSSLTSNAKPDVLKMYVSELKNYMLVLDSVRKNPITENSLKYVDFLNSDIAIKLDYKYASDDKSPNPLKLVAVKFKVLDNNNHELTDVKAFLRPEICFDSHYIEVFAPTQATTKLVQPGRKYVWIERNGVIIESRTEVVRRQTDESVNIINFLVVKK